MENVPRPKQQPESVEQRKERIRKQAVFELAKFSTLENDPELAAHCILLHGRELDDEMTAELLEKILSSTSSRGDLFAFRLLRDDPDLKPEFRDRLFQGLLRRSDGYTLKLTLEEVPNLGHWEEPLRARLTYILQKH